MALLQQIGLVTAGAQPWNPNICTAKGNRFAYCATLAIYIYQWEPDIKQFRLHSIVSAHKRTITALRWCPHDDDLLASASGDREILIWNISDQAVVARLSSLKGIPACIEWCPFEKNTIGFIADTGPLFLWNFSEANKLSNHLDGTSFLYQVTQFSWNPKQPGKIVYGHADGSLSLALPGQRIQKHVLRPGRVDETQEDDPVVDLEWDPLSDSFFLVANVKNGVRLIDSDSCLVVTQFKSPSAATRIKGLSWIAEAPGMFVTGDTSTGVLRVWSASKQTPIVNIKVKKTGFHSLCVVNQKRDQRLCKDGHPTFSATVSSTSASDIGSQKSLSSPEYALPPCKVVCVFIDGGVGLYNLARRNWDFVRELGHVETIFDCKFHPENPNLLATGSFDGTVKVWDVESLEAVATSPGNESIIYSVSWAPGDLNSIVAGTSKNGLFIWDLNQTRLIKRFTEHGKSSVYTVAWNQKDSKFIASAGADGFCVVRSIDGAMTRKYRHPGPVFGCDWSPKNRDMLATGCEDKLVRVFYLPTNSDQPIKSFSGHTAKVFHVKWCPLKDGILCSGSDDSTVRIWDYSQDTCVTVLEGHTGPVRGLLWHSEIPTILISGSWDYSIRVWDTRTGYCIENNLDHAADVYGLTSHPQRPFMIASCSRDSTLRIWNLVSLMQPLYASLLAGHKFNDLLASNNDAVSLPNNDWKFTGSTSQNIASIIERENITDQLKLLRIYSQFFLPSQGVSNLWTLISIVLNGKESHLPEEYANQIMHTTHMTMYKSSEAQELETAKASGVFGFAIGKPSKEQRLLKSSEVHAKLGQLERYCEIMVELGEWDKALAIAPGVSMEYWKNLTVRRATMLVNLDSLEAVPHLVACGSVTELVGFFAERMQLQDALLVAQAAKEGTISAFLHDDICLRNLSLKNNNILPHLGPKREDVANKLLRQTAEYLSSWYFNNGQAVHAACSCLAVSDVEGAMCNLIRGHELELAVSLGKLFPSLQGPLSLALELLSYRCEQMNHWDAALSLLRQLPNPELNFIKHCARFTGKGPAVDELHAKVNLPSLDECLSIGQDHLNKNNKMEALKFLLISSAPEQALDLGLTLLKDLLSQDLWTLNSVLPILDLLGCVRTEKAVSSKYSRHKSELLALSAYVGAFLAIRREYFSIVTPLFSNACQIVAKEKLELPISLHQMRLESEAWILHRVSSKHSMFSNSPLPSDEQQKTWASMKVKIGDEQYSYFKGEYVVSGSHFPSHSQSHISIFTKKKIKGPVFFLEDGFSALSYNDALMWARVNAYSPLGTGLRINPF